MNPKQINKIMFLNDFAYVTFVNNNSQYLNLTSVLLDSVRIFSKYSIYIYLIDVPHDVYYTYFKKFINDPQFKFVFLNDIQVKSIYNYKPYVIVHALENYIQSGYYIESDDILTPSCDKIKLVTPLLKQFPISPIHPDDVPVSQNDINLIDSTIRKTQHYIHAHVAFQKSNLPFLKEWFRMCERGQYRNADETALNIMYWKYNCHDHHLPIIDPYFEQFYSVGPSILETAYTLHGCKDASIQEKLLVDVLKYLKLL